MVGGGGNKVNKLNILCFPPVPINNPPSPPAHCKAINELVVFKLYSTYIYIYVYIALNKREEGGVSPVREEFITRQ